MSALYWTDFDCTMETRRIAHPATVHTHYDNEREACLAFLRLERDWPTNRDAGERYHCVRGPGGLVRGVRP